MTKSQLLILVAILAIIFGIYAYKDASIIMSTATDEPYVEQKKNHITGYDQGNRVFNIQLNRIKQERYPHILYVTAINHGVIYNPNQKKAITLLNADYGRINTNIKSILATANISAIIHPNTATKSIHVASQEFNYNHQKKAAVFKNKTQLTVDDIIITTERLTYTNNNDIIFFPNGFHLQSEHSHSTVNSAIIDVEHSLIIASQNMVTKYKKSAKKNHSPQVRELLASPTHITASRATIDFKRTKKSIVTYQNNVRVNQHKKQLETDQLTLNFSTEHYIASSNVSFMFDSLDWLVKSNPIKNNDIKNILKKKTKITTDYAIYDAKKNTVRLLKNIEFNQINFKLNSDEAIYDLKNEQIILSGNVTIKKFGITQFSSQKLILDIKNEVFKSGQGQDINEITIEL